MIVNLPSLTIRRGEVYALWGRNGLGKSTFFRMLAGVLPPDEGIFENGMSVNYQPQHPYIFKGSCLENVLLGSKTKDTNTAVKLLEHLELADRLQVDAQLLSGGQKQCMFIARSLLTDGDLLLLDEPFSAIDAIRSDDIARFVLNYCKNQGRTLMVVVHKVELLDIFNENRLCFEDNGKIDILTKGKEAAVV